MLGFDGVPEAGEFVRVVENERKARQLAGERANRLKTEALARRSGAKVSLEDVLKLAREGQRQGAQPRRSRPTCPARWRRSRTRSRACRRTRSRSTSSTAASAASTSPTSCSPPPPTASSSASTSARSATPASAAEREGVEIRTYTVIYKAIEELRAAMEGMLEPEEVEDIARPGRGPADLPGLARRHDRRLATSPRARSRAARRCAWSATAPSIYDGEIACLRRFNDDVREVAAGFECGIVLQQLRRRQGRRRARGLRDAQGRARARR